MLRAAFVTRVAQFEGEDSAAGELMFDARIRAETGCVFVARQLAAVGVQQAQERVKRGTQPLREDFDAHAPAFLRGELEEVRLQPFAAAIDGGGEFDGLRTGEGVVGAAAGDARQIIHHHQTPAGDAIGRDQARRADARRSFARHLHPENSAAGVGIRDQRRARGKARPQLRRAAQILAEEGQLGGLPRNHRARQCVVRVGGLREGDCGEGQPEYEGDRTNLSGEHDASTIMLSDFARLLRETEEQRQSDKHQFQSRKGP